MMMLKQHGTKDAPRFEFFLSQRHFMTKKLKTEQLVIKESERVPYETTVEAIQNVDLATQTLQIFICALEQLQPLDSTCLRYFSKVGKR